MIENIIEQEDDLAQLKDWLLIVPEYEEIAKLIIDYEAKKKKLDELEVLIIDISNEQEALNTLQEWLEVKPVYQELEQMIASYKKLASENGLLSELCQTIDKEQYMLITCQDELKLSRKAYDQFIKDHDNICPLCGGKIK